MPDGVTMVGVTTFTPEDAVVAVPGWFVVIFCVAAAAAARAAMPLICPCPDCVCKEHETYYHTNA